MLRPLVMSILGCAVVDGLRSTNIAATPCCASVNANVRPTGPPPAIRTGTCSALDSGRPSLVAVLIGLVLRSCVHILLNTNVQNRSSMFLKFHGTKLWNRGVLLGQDRRNRPQRTGR